MPTMRELSKDHKICAILRNVSDEIVVDYAKACVEGGVSQFEVAMNTPSAPWQITRLREYFGSSALVGAGTVITPQRCKQAHEAGAQFFLTPSAAVCTLEYCRKSGIPLLPGVMTPSDVGLCLEYGFDLMKLFPAGDLPAGYIKSLKGPFDGTDYVAVGGVTPDNIRTFFQNGFVGVGIGSNLFPKEYAAQRRWDLAAQAVAKLVEAASGV